MFLGSQILALLGFGAFWLKSSNVARNEPTNASKGYSGPPESTVIFHKFDAFDLKRALNVNFFKNPPSQEVLLGVAPTDAGGERSEEISSLHVSCHHFDGNWRSRSGLLTSRVDNSKQSLTPLKEGEGEAFEQIPLEKKIPDEQEVASSVATKIPDTDSGAKKRNLGLGQAF